MAKRRLKDEDAAELAKLFLRFSKRDKTRLTKPMKLRWIAQYVDKNCTRRAGALHAQMLDLADELWRETMIAYLEHHGIAIPEADKSDVEALTEFIYKRLPLEMVETSQRVCPTDAARWEYISMRKERPGVSYTHSEGVFLDLAKCNPHKSQYEAVSGQHKELTSVGSRLHNEIRCRLSRIDTIGGALTLMPDLILHISAIIEDIALESKTQPKRVVTEAMSDDKWMGIISALGTKALYKESTNGGGSGENNEPADEAGDTEDQVDGGDGLGVGASQEGGSDGLQDGAE